MQFNENNQENNNNNNLLKENKNSKFIITPFKIIMIRINIVFNFDENFNLSFVYSYNIIKMNYTI